MAAYNLQTGNPPQLFSSTTAQLSEAIEPTKRFVEAGIERRGGATGTLTRDQAFELSGRVPDGWFTSLGGRVSPVKQTEFGLAF
ncbi:MAG: hypothetical protein U0R17_00735 [Acidimicrobiia bacterium]